MSDLSITPAERALLLDALEDDVDFGWVLEHLGIAGAVTPHDWRPTDAQIDEAFVVLSRLQREQLIIVGHTEYVDAGPPGRLAPLKFVVESLEVVRARVKAAAATASDQGGWRFACWVTTPQERHESVVALVAESGPVKRSYR